MAQAIAPVPGEWTAADLVERFGPIPLARIRQDPATREVHVFTSPDSRVELKEHQTLEGGTLLPGFRLPLERLFAEPGQERA